ncbi:MAG: hypothetical protein NZM04_00750, partial [Methylacidiphilales bacterium]|nr:hypothetical protein [Candidatus Methylacidiphilales bacterium]
KKRDDLITQVDRRRALRDVQVNTLSRDEAVLQAEVDQASSAFQSCTDSFSGYAALDYRRASRRPIQLKQVSPSCGGFRSLRPTGVVLFVMCGEAMAVGCVLCAMLESAASHQASVSGLSELSAGLRKYLDLGTPKVLARSCKSVGDVELASFTNSQGCACMHEERNSACLEIRDLAG